MPRTSPIWSNKIRRSLFDKNEASSRCLWIHSFKFIFISIWVCKKLYKDKFLSSVSLPSTMQEHDIYLLRWPNLCTLRDEPLSTQSSMQNVLWQPLKKPDNKSLSLKKTPHKKKNNDKGIADQFTPYGSSAHHNLFKIFLETCIDRNKRTWTSSQQLVSCFFSGPGTLCSVTALPRLEGLCYPTVAPGTLQLRKMSGNGIM